MFVCFLCYFPQNITGTMFLHYFKPCIWDFDKSHTQFKCNQVKYTFQLLNEPKLDCTGHLSPWKNYHRDHFPSCIYGFDYAWVYFNSLTFLLNFIQYFTTYSFSTNLSNFSILENLFCLVLSAHIGIQFSLLSNVPSVIRYVT